MKKLLCFALVAIMVFSLVACGSTPATGETSGDESNPTGVNSGEENNPGEDTSEKEDASAKFPLTYTPKWSTKDAKREDNPEGTLSIGFGNFAYDPTVEIVLEYCKDQDKLFTAINGASDWPAELNDTWRGYGYVAIETNETASIRTLAVGQFDTKHANVILQHENALTQAGFNISKDLFGSPKEEGTKFVPYCSLVSTREVTIQQIATAAQEALYLQAWHLVPAAQQGVLVTVNGRAYTVNDILKELAG